MAQGICADPEQEKLRKQRIGLAHKGKPKSPESVAKMKLHLGDRKGKNNANYKGILKNYTCETCKVKFLGKYGCKNRFCTRQCKWDYQKTLTGKNAYHYKNGDYSAENSDRRNMSVYIRWRKEVLARDHFACVLCGSKKELHCDHIESFKDYPKLRYELSNGRTLCKRCHYEVTFRKSPLNNWEAYSRWAKVTRGKPTERLLQPHRLSEETG